jgi:hypothetical protein
MGGRGGIHNKEMRNENKILGGKSGGKGGKNWVTPHKMEPAFKSFIIKWREGTTHKTQVQMRRH